MCLITFIKKKFSFTFYNKFVEIYQLFPCKTAYYIKRQKKIPKLFWKNLLFMVQIWSWNRNRTRNRNFSKVGTGTGTITFSKVGTGTGTGTITFQDRTGTGTVKNSYGSTTLVLVTPKPILMFLSHVVTTIESFSGDSTPEVHRLL